MRKTKQTRKQHGDEFKAEALKLANQVGAAQALNHNPWPVDP